MARLQKLPNGHLAKSGHLTLCKVTCPNGDPPVRFTLTFAGGGTKEFMGVDFESGVPQVLCPDNYTCDSVGLSGETWAKDGDGGEIILRAVRAPASKRVGYVGVIFETPSTVARLRMTKTDYTGGSPDVSGTAQSLNLSTKWTTAAGLNAIPPLDNNHFGQITTNGIINGDVTIVWERADAADWNLCGI